MWWLGDWIRLILHQLPLGKKYFVLYRSQAKNRILGGITHYLSLIPLTLERSKDRLSLVYPPDLARLTPSDRYPELDNIIFRPV